MPHDQLFERRPLAFPWDGDKPLQTRLQLAGWRYAMLIGVIAPDNADEGLTVADHQADLSRYPHFVKAEEGSPCWVSEDATAFVSEFAGCSREIGAAWLGRHWPDVTPFYRAKFGLA